MQDKAALQHFESALASMKVHSTKKLGSALKKPILLLLVLSRIYRGIAAENVFRFPEIESELSDLIEDFGGRTADPRPEQPFYYLSSSEDLWSLTSDFPLPESTKKLPRMGILRDDSTYASLPPTLFEYLVLHRDACLDFAGMILDRFWSPTLHDEIRDRLGFPENMVISLRRARDPDFTRATLLNYENRCAACGFQLLISGHSAGLEAAHIRWHAYDGPDVLENGLALCRLHHWALDRGVIGIDPSKLTIKVSTAAVGNEPISKLQINSLEGAKLQTAKVKAGRKYLEWQLENCFLG